MKKNLLNAYVFEEEIDFIKMISQRASLPVTAVASFFLRRGIKDYQYDDTTFPVEFTKNLIEAEFAEYAATDQGRDHIERLAEGKINEFKKRKGA